jgi:hypothetical protein
VFSNSFGQLLLVTPWVLSSKKTDTQNESVSMFDCGTIKTIDCLKKKQGANLEKTDNLHLMSYYSTSDFVQGDSFKTTWISWKCFFCYKIRKHGALNW